MAGRIIGSESLDRFQLAPMFGIFEYGVLHSSICGMLSKIESLSKCIIFKKQPVQEN